MDTNMSQALKLAGGILIALVLITGLSMLFSRLSPSQNTLEDIKAFEQTQDFNKEFEVYIKDIMYGLDVISVINKAASYNKMYIDAYGWSDDLRNNYLVDVELTLNSDVEENLQIYYTNSVAGQKKELEYLAGSFMDLNAPFNQIQPPYEDRNIDFDNDVFSKLGITDGVRQNNLLSRNPSIILDSGDYSLIENNPLTNYCDADLYREIIGNSVQPQIVIRNPQNNYIVGEWTKVVYTTGVNNFKSKKFRCFREETEYSEITKRITKLVFAEI